METLDLHLGGRNRGAGATIDDGQRQIDERAREPLQRDDLAVPARQRAPRLEANRPSAPVRSGVLGAWPPPGGPNISSAPTTGAPD
jgi:hypothetical protein